jgi:hypothetical protein
MAYPVETVPGVAVRYLVTIEEIAPELSMSAWTLSEACRRLEFPHVKLPHRRRILIDRRHVAAFLEGAPLEPRRLPGGGRVVKPARVRGS